MNILFIGEKPSTTDRLLSQIPHELRDQTIITINLNPIGSLRFDYPRKMLFKDIPLINEPQYKVGPDLPSICTYLNGQRTESLSRPEWLRDYSKVRSFFQNFDQFIVGVDPDHSGQFAAMQWLNFAGISLQMDTRLSQVLYLVDMSKKGIDQAWKETNAPSVDWSNAMLEFAQAKRFFDYNFNINSMVLFGKIFHDLGVDTTDFSLTKSQLMLLYILNNKNIPLSIGKIIKLMEKYPGSGKYVSSEKLHPLFGSVSSRLELIEQLSHRRLLEDANDSKNHILQVSNIGRTFISRLHKKTFDPDLHFRLAMWCNSAFNGNLLDVKSEMKRYLRTLFGKQVRFMNADESRPTLLNGL